MTDNVKQFRNIATEIGDLYEKKNKAYGNSFSDTYNKLGIISAVTRISDKYNRLCNLTTNPYIDNLGESIDDTLRDLAAYAIMTLIERNNHIEDNNKSKKEDAFLKEGYDYTCIKDFSYEITGGYISFIKGNIYHCFKDNSLGFDGFDYQISKNQFMKYFTINPIKNK